MSIYLSMSDMICCPFHEDRRPSMKIYGDFAWCFVCKVSIPTKSLNLGEYQPATHREPTDIPARIKYIQSLPTKLIRGLKLHYDSEGFYIVWPDKSYYKKRMNSGKSRYIGPTGKKAPLLVLPSGTEHHLVVVEGELNALSLHQATCGDFTIASPGSASEFMRHIAKYGMYSRVTLVLDHDAAGVVHGCSVRDLLLKSGIRATLRTMKTDFNELLQQDEELIRAWLKENL